MGNAEYLTLFYSVIFPVAHQFNPQLVLVTTGYGSLGGTKWHGELFTLLLLITALLIRGTSY